MKKISIAILSLLAISTQAINIRVFSDEDQPSDADVEAELQRQLDANGGDLQAVLAAQQMAASGDSSAEATPTAAAAVDVSAASDAVSYISETKLDGGITINVLSQGTGNQCQSGQVAKVQYTGALASNGEVFDSSIPRGEPISFTLGEMRVIKCWEDAMVQMQVGEKADIGCPSATAYGAKSKPKIPANSDLIFNVEVVSCE